MPINLTDHWLGFWALGFFFFAYLLVMAEEFIQPEEIQTCCVGGRHYLGH